MHVQCVCWSLFVGTSSSITIEIGFDVIIAPPRIPQLGGRFRHEPEDMLCGDNPCLLSATTQTILKERVFHDLVSVVI